MNKYQFSILITFLLITNSWAKDNSFGYKRSLFGKWQDLDGNCRDTRAEVLIERSEVPVTFKKNGCLVDKGLWSDFYYQEKLTEASSIDIDHVVPLKHAYETGAAQWSSKKRIEFSNDYENLVITNKKYNRQKGAKTPLEWMPVQKEYACKYLKKWLNIKVKYSLSINPKILQFKNEVCQ